MTSHREDRMPGNGFRVFLIAAIVLACLAITEFLLMPLVYRRQGIPNRELALLGLINIPGCVVDDTPINTQGFTGSLVKQEGRREEVAWCILTLGGSTFFNHRMAERLAEELSSQSSVKLELVGGALRTHTSRASVLKYRTFFRKERFDYVLLYEGINDLWANNVAPEHYKSDFSHLIPWYKRNWLLDRSLIARYLYNALIWSKERRLVPNASDFRSLASTEQNIRQLIRMIRSDQGTPVLMTFAWHIPADYTIERFSAGQLDYVNPTHYDEWPVELWGPPDIVREGLRRHNRMIRDIARQEQVLLIDQEAMFREKPNLFGDVCHFNEEGTDYFISNIASYFRALHLLKSGRPMGR